MFPAFLDLKVDEMHVEMASREFAEIEIIGEIADAHGRRGRHHRREELLHRDARGRGRPRAPLPASTRRPSACPSRPTAASARRRAGPRGTSCANMVAGVRQVREELGV